MARQGQSLGNPLRDRLVQPVQVGTFTVLRQMKSVIVTLKEECSAL